MRPSPQTIMMPFLCVLNRQIQFIEPEGIRKNPLRKT